MARIILKMPYIKSCSLPSNYASYIATREGVDKAVNISNPTGKPTKKQIEFINKLIADAPDSKDSFEYEDYIKNPTIENASLFISLAAEQNPELFPDRENYVSYIAMRPRAEKLCDHGLFGVSDDVVDLEKVKKEIQNQNGNVWTPIISLRRDDAERLGYDNAGAWKRLIKIKHQIFGECLGVPPSDLQMYAAYHDEGHHPHIHMLVYSANPKNGYLTVGGIEKLKSSFAKDIFKQELYQLYDKKTDAREKISDEAKQTLSDLVEKINQNDYCGSDICGKLIQLSDELNDVKGKKVYGYLRPDVKAMVDDIVKDLSCDETMRELYQTWCGIQNEIIGTYKSNFLEHPPLWANKEFKKIKNAVIAEALKIGDERFLFEETEYEPEFFPEENHVEPESEISDEDTGIAGDDNYKMEWSAQYKTAQNYLYGRTGKPDLQRAFELFCEEADKCNVLAIHDLGAMYRLGLYVETDEQASQEYYKKAFEGFSYLEEKKNNPYIEYRLGKLYYHGFGAEQSYGEAKKQFELSNNKYAQYWLGKMYYFGYGVEPDFKMAAYYYMESGKEGNGHAQYALGKLYCSGEGVNKDYNEAAKWFELAALQENQFAQYRLGRLYYFGLGVEQSFEKALKWFILSAEQGNQFAQYFTGKMFSEGKGTAVDYSKAYDYFILSAKQENHFAEYELGKMFQNGNGMETDDKKAYYYYQKALAGFVNMEKQSSSLQYRIGKMYESALGTEKNMDKAIEYYEMAAADQNSFAEFSLAKIYIYGNGVGCDLEKGLEYLERAIEHGNEYAKDFKEKMFAQPSAAQSVFKLFYHLARMVQDHGNKAIDKHNQVIVDSKLMREIMERKRQQGMKF